MLVDDYEVEVTTPECDLESPIYMGRVSLGSDISEALPYLNASVEKGEYVPGVPALVFREGGRKYAVRPREILISNISDRHEALGLARVIVDKINKIWEDRANIVPSTESWEKPKVLDLLKLLPGTNCRKCSVPTCMAFAAKLSEGKASLDDCPPLCEESNADKLAALREKGL
ncbi:MAG: (Fe-S)-binding protein [Candidatus Geothermincolia bacterium]